MGLCLVGFALAVSVAEIAGVRMARADTSWNMVQITCVPAIDYFDLRTFSLEDEDVIEDARVRSELTTGFGLLWVGPDLREPYTCPLPSGPITVHEVRHHYPDGSGQCTGDEDAILAVSVGKRSFQIDGWGRCGHVPQDVEISRFQTTVCARKVGTLGKDDEACTTHIQHS